MTQKSYAIGNGINEQGRKLTFSLRAQRIKTYGLSDHVQARQTALPRMLDRPNVPSPKYKAVYFSHGIFLYASTTKV